MLKTLITVAGVAGTLGSAAPAFADWYQPAPPVYVAPATPYYGYGYGQRYDNDWRWREREAWRRHEAWEHYRRWHHGGWGGWHHGYHRW